jgi:hypothetical protein
MQPEQPVSPQGDVPAPQPPTPVPTPPSIPTQTAPSEPTTEPPQAELSPQPGVQAPAPMDQGSGKTIKLGRKASFILVLVISLLMTAGGFLLFKHNGVPADFKRTTGQVKQIRNTYASSAQGIQYAPVISFKAANGKSIEFSGQSHSDQLKYRQGQIVDVIYDPANPNYARLEDDVSSNNFAALGLMIAGPVLLGFAIFANIFGRRSKLVSRLADAAEKASQDQQ